MLIWNIHVWYNKSSYIKENFKEKIEVKNDKFKNKKFKIITTIIHKNLN